MAATLWKKPFIGNVEHGIFVIESFKFLIVVNLLTVDCSEIENNTNHMEMVVMLNGTPLATKKPIFSKFAHKTNTTSKWLDNQELFPCKNFVLMNFLI